MKQEELFIGAIVLWNDPEGIASGIYPISGFEPSGCVFIKDSFGDRQTPFEEIEPVKITHKLLLRLEGENGERFELVNGFYFINGGVRAWCEDDKMGVDWFYKNPFNGCFFGIGCIHTLQTRVRLDTGIVLNLKPE